MNKNPLPSVGKLLQAPAIQDCLQKIEREQVTQIIREEIDSARQQWLSQAKENTPIKITEDYYNFDKFTERVLARLELRSQSSFKKVINASGILLHTNLGRAPLGKNNLQAIHESLEGYSNLEFNLKKGKRGSRHQHLAQSLKKLCQAEDALVVNNNAASVLISLAALCSGKEVIVSRGELIEIGGSFRIPDIMAAANCQLVEVGSTNKTHLSDYRNAINENTAAIFKVHRSNFSIHGFTKEVGNTELKELSTEFDIPLLYDLGSGLPRPIKGLDLAGEPTVSQSIAEGCDLVMFSCDKLMSAAQGGVLCGRQDLIKRISSHPLMRAMRISKLDLAVIENVCQIFLAQQETVQLPLYQSLTRTQKKQEELIKQIQSGLAQADISASILPSHGRIGGGTLPDLEIPSLSLRIDFDSKSKSQAVTKAEKLHRQLLVNDSPVLSYLKGGEIHFDILSIFPEEIDSLITAIKKAYLEL